jgi:hypothetical protein
VPCESFASGELHARAALTYRDVAGLRRINLRLIRSAALANRQKVRNRTFLPTSRSTTAARRPKGGQPPWLYWLGLGKILVPNNRCAQKPDP